MLRHGSNLEKQPCDPLGASQPTAASFESGRLQVARGTTPIRMLQCCIKAHSTDLDSFGAASVLQSASGTRSASGTHYVI